MVDRTRINLVVSSDKKERWEDYIDESPEYSTMADLIRTSVAHEIADRQNSGPSEELSIQLAEVVDGLDEVTDRLINVEKRLRNLENQSIRDPDLDRLTGELFSHLPDVRPGTRQWEQELQTRRDQLQAAQAGHEPDEEGIRRSTKAWEGTAEDLAIALNESPSIVRQALDQLMSDTHLVRKTDDGRYWIDG